MLAQKVLDEEEDTIPYEVWIEADCEKSKRLSVCERRRIGPGRFVIGRRRSFVGPATEETPDMLVAQSEPFTVSRVHCAIEVTAEQVVVRDLESKLGMVVNQTRLGGPKGKTDSVVLKSGKNRLVLGPRNGGIHLLVTVAKV